MGGGPGATDQENQNSDIDEECTSNDKKNNVETKADSIVKSFTPTTADGTAKSGVVGQTSTDTLTATLEESEEELIKVAQKNSKKRPRLVDEE